MYVPAKLYPSDFNLVEVEIFSAVSVHMYVYVN